MTLLPMTPFWGWHDLDPAHPWYLLAAGMDEESRFAGADGVVADRLPDTAGRAGYMLRDRKGRVWFRKGMNTPADEGASLPIRELNASDREYLATLQATLFEGNGSEAPTPGVSTAGVRSGRVVGWLWDSANCRASVVGVTTLGEYAFSCPSEGSLVVRPDGVRLELGGAMAAVQRYAERLQQELLLSSVTEGKRILEGFQRSLRGMVADGVVL